MTPTIRDIIKQHLRTHGYDGLTDIDGCACLIDDLEPCEGSALNCTPGYRVPCGPTVDCDGKCEWHIVTTRPTPVEPEQEG